MLFGAKFFMRQTEYIKMHLYKKILFGMEIYLAYWTTAISMLCCDIKIISENT